MVLKYLVTLLAISSVSAQRFGSDPKTWSSSAKQLTCDQCMLIANKTESALSYQACLGTKGEENIVCRDIVSLATEVFSPDVVCQEIGYCPKNVWWSLF
jgi:hypothetical protein